MNAGLAFQDVAISAAYAMAGCHYTVENSSSKCQEEIINLLKPNVRHWKYLWWARKLFLIRLGQEGRFCRWLAALLWGCSTCQRQPLSFNWRGHMVSPDVRPFG